MLGWGPDRDYNIGFEVRGIDQEAVSGKMQLMPWRSGQFLERNRWSQTSSVKIAAQDILDT